MRILEEVTGDSCQEPEAERPEIGRRGDQSARSKNGAGLELALNMSIAKAYAFL
jgi:hypothetical protein